MTYRHIHSFSLRGSRLGKRHEALLAERAELLISVPRGEEPVEIAADARVDLAAEFGREAPLIVEVGPGSGEQAVGYAVRHPEVNILLVEAWHPGVGRCVASIVRAGVENVRVLEADAVQALPVVFGLAASRAASAAEIEEIGPGVDPALPGSTNPRAAELWTFFPDPWRKTRHHKRRLVAPRFGVVAAGILEDQGLWRMATDWDDYAWQMRDTLEVLPYFVNPYAGQNPDPNDREPERGGFARRWEERELTRFEERGREAGRSVHDLVAVRKKRG